MGLSGCGTNAYLHACLHMFVHLSIAHVDGSHGSHGSQEPKGLAQAKGAQSSVSEPKPRTPPPACPAATWLWGFDLMVRDGCELRGPSTIADPFHSGAIHQPIPNPALRAYPVAPQPPPLRAHRYRPTAAPVLAPYIDHNYVSHNYIGHNYIGRYPLRPVVDQRFPTGWAPRPRLVVVAPCPVCTRLFARLWHTF